MRRLTGAGSDALLSLVSGPTRAATVVGAGPHATYLQMDEPDGELLALVVRHAVRVPCAIVLPDGVEPPAELLPGTRADVGQRAVRWAGGELVVVRWWAAAAVTAATGLPAAAPVEPDASLSTRVAALGVAIGTHALPSLVPAALERAANAIDDGDAGAVADAVLGVLGAGPGLTPSADDAVAGLLLTARSWHGSDVDPVLCEAGKLLTPHLAGRTTAVSAGLLRHAAQGRGAPEVVRAVEHLTGRRVDDEREVLRDLVRLGHTSGRDTALGVLALLGRHLRHESPPHARRGALPRHDPEPRPTVPQPDPHVRESA